MLQPLGWSAKGISKDFCLTAARPDKFTLIHSKQSLLSFWCLTHMDINTGIASYLVFLIPLVLIVTSAGYIAWWNDVSIPIWLHWPSDIPFSSHGKQTRSRAALIIWRLWLRNPTVHWDCQQMFYSPVCKEPVHQCFAWICLKDREDCSCWTQHSKLCVTVTIVQRYEYARPAHSPGLFYHQSLPSTFHTNIFYLEIII